MRQLSQLYRKLHLHACIEGASAMSGRHTFAVRVSNSNIDLKHINVLLALRSLKAANAMMDADPVRLGKIAAGVL